MGPLQAWNPTSNPCTDRWPGVNCNFYNTRVAGIVLSRAGLFSLQLDLDLTGGALAELAELDLSHNFIGGVAPRLETLPQLTVLNLGVSAQRAIWMSFGILQLN